MNTAPRKAEEVISLKVTLRGIRPPIWRRLEVPSRISLGILHDAIQAAMGWGDHHLYAFDVAGRSYGDPARVDDVKGVWGYQNLLAALADPSRSQVEGWSEWMERGFDPEEFSVDVVDTRIGTRLKSRPA